MRPTGMMGHSRRLAQPRRRRLQPAQPRQQLPQLPHRRVRPRRARPRPRAPTPPPAPPPLPPARRPRLPRPQPQPQLSPHIVQPIAVGWQERIVIQQEPTSPTKGTTTAVRLLVFTEPGSVIAMATATMTTGSHHILASQTTSTMRDMLGMSRNLKNLQLYAMTNVATLIVLTPFIQRK